jgi:hypothetical protein
VEGLKPGTKLGCGACGTEVILVRPGDGAAPTCCGQPLQDPARKEQGVGE